MARSKANVSPKGRASSKKKTISIDFEGVESGGGKPVPDGIYTASVFSVTEEEGQDSGNPYLKWKWKIETGKSKGAVVFDNTSQSSQALWRLKTVLECLGMDVPNSVMDLDLDELVDLSCDIEITNEEYEGKDRPKITGFLTSDGEEEEVEEEEEVKEEKPAPRSRKKKAVVEEEEEEEPEEEEEEPEEEEEEEEKPSRSRKKKAPAKSKAAPRKLRVGSKIKWEDEEGETIKGVITELDGEIVTAEDAEGDEWELDLNEVEAA